MADDFIQRPVCPRSTAGYDDDDVARVVAFVLSLQRLHSARFNILTKIPGATGGGGAGDKGGLRSVERCEGMAVWFAGMYRAKLSRRAATGTLARRAATKKTGERDSHPGTKVSRATSPRCHPVFVDGKLARSTHESSESWVRKTGGGTGGTAGGGAKGRLHERVT